MNKTYSQITCASAMSVLLLAPIAHAERYTGEHQFTRAEYVTIRSLQVCINRQGWENEQETNDERLKQMLKARNIDFSFAKLMRENYKYEHGVAGSIRAEVDFEIADAIKSCMQEPLFEAPLPNPFEN